MIQCFHLLDLDQVHEQKADYKQTSPILIQVLLKGFTTCYLLPYLYSILRIDSSEGGEPRYISQPENRKAMIWEVLLQP